MRRPWGTSDINNDSTTAIAFKLSKGTVITARSSTVTGTATYDRNVVNHLDFIFNSHNTDTFEVNGLNLGPNQGHVYVNGIHIATVTAPAISANNDPGRVALRTFSGDNTASLLVDNVAVRDGVFIVPEPGSLALLGLGGLLLMTRQKRHTSRQH